MFCGWRVVRRPALLLPDENRVVFVNFAVENHKRVFPSDFVGVVADGIHLVLHLGIFGVQCTKIAITLERVGHISQRVQWQIRGCHFDVSIRVGKDAADRFWG